MVKNRATYLVFLIFVFFSTSILYSCSHSINVFDVQPRTISEDDSVRITMNVDGPATILVKEYKAQDDYGVTQTGDSTPRYINYTLVVEKGKKEEFIPITVVVYPNFFTNDISLSTIDRKGDTIIAKDTLSFAQWGTLKYQVFKVSSGSERELYVVHHGQSATVDSEGNFSFDLQGTPIGGEWEIRTLRSEAEKRDSSLCPTQLTLKALIQHKK